MIMGRNLQPLTEYVNRRVQEEVIKKTPPLFQEMGSQNLLTITFLPGKVIGELNSEGIITKWEGMSRVKKGKAQS
jgi:hypothetical protein